MGKTTITIRISADDLAEIDRAVEAGRYSSRSELLRLGAARIVADAREEAIVDAVRRSYEGVPDAPDGWGEAAWSDRIANGSE